MTCESKYQTIVKMAGEDFFETTKHSALAAKAIEYDYLNDKGKHELEIILTLLFKERHIKHSPMMISVASLLIIFMKPSEVYFVLSELINSSTEIQKNQEQAHLIRWHLTFDKNSYFKLLTTFVRSYLKTTVRGKRSLLKHMNKMGFDFNLFVDLCFKSIITHFVPLPIALNILMIYLVEGVKIIFRFTYALLKIHKNFIKKCTDAD